VWPLCLQVDITDPVLEAIATKYTFEAGCRGMERQLEKICRKVTPRGPAPTDLQKLFIQTESRWLCSSSSLWDLSWYM
jgi:ATP-dependent Lon protease